MELLQFPVKKEQTTDQRLAFLESKINLRNDLVEITDEEDLEFAEEIKANLAKAVLEQEELRQELMED